MIIINLKGGLGNQMFQYATAYAIHKKFKKKILCDIRLQEEYKKTPPARNVPRNIELDLFDIDIKTPDKSDLIKVMQFNKSYRIRNYLAYFLDKFEFLALRERGRIYESRIFKYKYKNLYLDGYWQSEKYFNDFREEILKLYNFNKVKNLAENLKLIRDINLETAVCVNVRRADFLNNPEHNTVTIDYYKTALNLLLKKIGRNVELYIFSDDISWCKKNFTFSPRINFMEENRIGDRYYNYLYLMTCFKNYIIPNSSFAWWGAWLSSAKNKIVIVPKKWSGLVHEDKIDIVPNSWIKI